MNSLSEKWKLIDSKIKNAQILWKIALLYIYFFTVFLILNFWSTVMT